MSPMVESDRSATLDDVISAVADEHRRAVLRLLTDTDAETTDLDPLVDGVVERVDADRSSVAEHRTRTRIVLHQVHLPKLDSRGLVRYDAEAKQVQGTPGDLCQELLDLIEAHEADE